MTRPYASMTLPDVFPDIWSGIISFLRSGETESYVGQADLARAARVNSRLTQSRRHLSPSANIYAHGLLVNVSSRARL